MRCPYCNEEHPGTAAFCPRTGQKILAARTCGNCGTALEDSWKVCTACGARVDQQEKIEHHKEKTASPSWKTFQLPGKLLLGIFSVLLIILVGGTVTPLLLPTAFSTETATPLPLPTVFPTESSTPVSTDTPRPTVTPRGTLTATKEPDYMSTPWAQYECNDKSQIILRGGASGRVVKDKIELLERPAAPAAPSYKVLRLLQARERILVLDGPQCKDGETWWKVTTESSTIGWVREIDSAGRRLLKR